MNNIQIEMEKAITENDYLDVAFYAEECRFKISEIQKELSTIPIETLLKNINNHLIANIQKNKIYPEQAWLTKEDPLIKKINGYIQKSIEHNESKEYHLSLDYVLNLWVALQSKEFNIFGGDASIYHCYRSIVQRLYNIIWGVLKDMPQ